jgi:hypothetical protein
MTFMLVVGFGITGAVGQDYGSGAPRGHYNNGYGPQQAQSWPPNNQSNWPPNNQFNGQRYTTVTVTNRGQNGYPDQVVQQQVPCGSQYYDGYRQRIAPQCWCLALFDLFR